MRRIKFLGVLAAVAVLVGCVGTGAKEDGKAAETCAPLRVAVFVGDGARSIGAFRWVEIATLAENTVATPVDGEAIRAGVLDAADVLIMPGGSAHIEANDLGEEGREKVKLFIRGGGGYIGTCAGFYLMTQPRPGVRKNYLGLLPFVDTKDGGNGQAELMFEFNDNAVKFAGITKGKKKIRYSGGPVPVHTESEVDGAKAVVVATYACDYNPRNTRSISKAGHPAVVAEEFGKGRMFVFTCHPEIDVDDHACIEGAFRYVTGREIRWRYPQRKPGQLAVGFICDDSFGPETARFVQRLLRDGEFDMIPVNASQIGEGALRHLDAVLLPSVAAVGNPKNGIYGTNAERTRAFVARGGRIVAWGNAAERAKSSGIDGIVTVADAEAALAELRAFVASDVPASEPFPAKVAKPVKAAVFAGDGCSMGNIPQILEMSSEYEVTVVGAKEISSGALADCDVLYMPGGYSSIAYQTLGEGGRRAIVDFVRGGGFYYGVCGGAFLVSQTKMKPGEVGMLAGDTPFLGLVPFKEDLPHHYRGKAPVNIRLAEEGRSIFPKSGKTRTVWYSGGPAFIAADEVEDSEFEVFARYDSRVVSTLSPKPTPDMNGKAAIVGGRVGKGKVYAQCPHPEAHERTVDMVRDAFAWLAGVRPTGVLPHRVRGSSSVLVVMGFRAGMNAAVRFVLKTLLHDRRFDCRIVNTMDNNELAHSDTVVLCLFDKNSWTPELKAFVANGGKVVVVAETEKKRNLAANFGGATIVDSYKKVIDAINR